MIPFLIYRPVSVLMLVLALLILSGITINKLGTSLLPDLAIPRILIKVEAPDYSPHEVEDKILAPIRRYMQPITGLEDFESKATWKGGEIELQFAYGVDMEKAFIETNEMLDLSMNTIPAEIKRPRVIKSRAEDLPVFYLSIFLKEHQNDSVAFLQLSEYVEEVLRRRLEQLPEIAMVDIHGTQPLQIVIRPDIASLKTHGVTQQDIQQSLTQSNLPFTSVTVSQRAYQYTVRIGKPLSNIADIKNVTLKIGDRVVPLGKLADIYFAEQSTQGAYLFNGTSAISLAIIKTPHAPLYVLDQRIIEVTDQLQNDRPAYTLKVTRDQTALLRVTLNNLKTSLILGCLLAISIVFFFYSRWQIPAIIGIIIPVSLILSIMFFYVSGLSINMLSLSGLLLGLGLMIDNGIIVLDNITQEWYEGKILSRACTTGTNEMIRPLLTSMLTTISVFVPLIFLSGISGALFTEQAAAIAICLIISYLVSITLLPTLYFLFLKKKGNKFLKKPTSLTDTLTKFYNKGFTLSIRRPMFYILAASLLIAISIFLLSKLPIQRFPILPERSFEVFIEWDEPLPPYESKQRLTTLFGDWSVPWQAHIGVDQYLLNNLYEGSLNTAQVVVDIPEDQSGISLKNEISKNFYQRFPDSRLTFMPDKNHLEIIFPTQEEFLESRIFFSDMSESQEEKKFDHIVNLVKEWPDTKHVKGPDFDRSFVVTPLQENLTQYNINQDRLVSELKKELNEDIIMQLTSFQYSTPLVIAGSDIDIQEITYRAAIRNEDGVEIPMHQLVSVQEVRTLRNIPASAQGKFWPLMISSKNPDGIKKKLTGLAQVETNTKMEVLGSYWRNKKLQNEMLYCLLAALVLLYFLMTAQFESFIQPIIILLEIPISLAGGIIVLWLSGASINIMSLIGMIVTVGIIINDSIIKIDTINRLRRQGLALKDALHKGGMKRINPIIMTSLTTILAVVPFLWGDDLGRMLQRPLALMLIGGMITGTLMSLFFIPLFYYHTYKNLE